MNPRDVPTVPDAGEDDAREMPSRLGHFEIVGRLGAGGMGLVFEGRDAVLDRRVALKLLHPGRMGNPIAPARLLREAQALAKLSHPNVVMVYEVGMAGDDPFVAMELVEGVTMAEWIKEAHPWREVLDVFIAVGHGLAAVHALGLVHRDFKPSNVLFDKRGTPKLGDFGLVRPIDDSSDGGTPITDTTITTTITQTGSVLGTPAYMAPEQRLGVRVDARADQFSFAKTLKEALREPIPAKLQPIIARAMSELPDERYPTMAQLLDALARVRRGNRARWIGFGGAAAVLAAIAIAWSFGRSQSAEEVCPRPTERLAKVWSEQRRTALQQHLLAIDPALGAQRFAAATGVLDRGATNWADQHVDACETSRAGRASDTLLDRRMACLDRALLEIDGTVALLERAPDRTKLDDAMKAVVGLPTLDECADTKSLMELLPRPTDPVQRAEADALTRESIDIDVALRTGGTKDTNVGDRANAAVARARVLGDPETLARALRSLAGVQLENEAGEPTLATLREAITVASSAHDDRMVAELWSKLLSTLVAVKKPAEAQTLVSAAEAAVARTKSSTQLAVTFLDAKAAVVLANEDTARAQEYIATATKLLDEANAASPFSPFHSLLVTVKTRQALAFSVTKDWAKMAEAFRDAVELANAQFGPDHPTVMLLHYRTGIALRRTGDLEGSLAEFREAARIGEARLSPSPSLANYIFAVGTALLVLQRFEEAIEFLERSIAMSRSTLPPDDARLADPVSALAAAYVNTKRYDKAKPLLDENIAILEKRHVEDDEKLGIAYFNRGEWGAQTHRCDLTQPDLTRALAIYEKIGTRSDVYGTLFTVAECQLDLHQTAAAIATSDRVLAANDASPAERGYAKVARGKARYQQGDKTRGLAEVREGRGELVKLEISEGVDRIDLWLANPDTYHHTERP